MPRATFFMPFLCHNFSQIFELSNFFQNLTRKVFKKLVFYLINSKLTKSRTFESNTAPPHISNFPRTQGFKSRTNWRYPAHSGNSGKDFHGKTIAWYRSSTFAKYSGVRQDSSLRQPACVSFWPFNRRVSSVFLSTLLRTKYENIHSICFNFSDQILDYLIFKFYSKYSFLKFYRFFVKIWHVICLITKHIDSRNFTQHKMKRNQLQLAGLTKLLTRILAISSHLAVDEIARPVPRNCFSVKVLVGNVIFF